MAAQSLNCPNCGAAASTDSSRCGHCNSRLATVSCPECFGMMFRGAKFCSHCGAKAERQELKDGETRPCPGCRVNTNAIVIGKVDLRECPKCEGLWADTDCMQRICTDREQQAAVLGVAAPIPQPLNARLEPIRYRPCPVCRQLMNRVNFANCSSVVVDVCRQHGTWFDKDELRRIVEFIQRGGFDKARAREIAELDRQRRKLEAARNVPSHDTGPAYGASSYDSREGALVDVAASVVTSFFFD